jgi:hypothetical protein
MMKKMIAVIVVGWTIFCGALLIAVEIIAVNTLFK